MAEKISLNVGDIIRTGPEYTANQKVVVETRPYLNAADIIRDKETDEVKRIGFGGSITGTAIEVIGSMALNEIIEGMNAQWSGNMSDEDKHNLLGILKEQQEEGPIEVELPTT